MITQAAQAERRAHRYSQDLGDKDKVEIRQINCTDADNGAKRVTFFFVNRNPETGNETSLVQEMLLTASQARQLAGKLAGGKKLINNFPRI
jgi:hypothetical protein